MAVQPRNASGQPLDAFGYLPLIDSPGKIVEGEWMTIIQHPGSKRKQICVRENKLLSRTADVLRYSTDTEQGSSGSPMFNNDWQVVALHHCGVPEMRNDVSQTVDGRHYDPAGGDDNEIKWIANEGIRVSRVVDALRQMAPQAPTLEPIFNMTPERAHDVINGFARSFLAIRSPAVGLPVMTTPSIPSNPLIRTFAMATRSVDVTLDITDDGRVSVRQAGLPPSEAFSEAARPAAAAQSASQRSHPALWRLQRRHARNAEICDLFRSECGWRWKISYLSPVDFH